jgi:hypothetical protein
MPTYSYSQIRTARRCMKAHDYKYNQRLQRKRKKVTLFRGEILHEMLNARATRKLYPKSPTPSPEKILDRYSKKYRILFREEREMYGDIIGDLRRIYEGYERQYKEDEYEVLSSEECVITTIKDDVKFVGYIDKRVQDREGTIWIKDHKTCKSIPDDEARFADYQLILYLWAWNRENSGKEASGLVWDYIRTKPPAIPEPLKNGELTKRANIDTDYFTYRSEIDRLKLDPKEYKGLLKSLKEKKSTFFRRRVLPAPPKRMIERIVNDFRTSVIMIEALRHTDAGQVRSMAYDCNGCEFFDLCQAELRDLDSDFIRKTQFTVKEPEHAHGDEENE